MIFEFWMPECIIEQFSSIFREFYLKNFPSGAKFVASLSSKDMQIGKNLIVHKTGMLSNIGKKLAQLVIVGNLVSTSINFQPNLRGKVIIAVDFAWNDLYATSGNIAFHGILTMLPEFQVQTLGFYFGGSSQGGIFWGCKIFSDTRTCNRSVYLFIYLYISFLLVHPSESPPISVLFYRSTNQSISQSINQYIQSWWK